MKKIKVLHTEWSSGWGGQEIRIISEMEMMRNLGCELALACREDSMILPKAQEKGFKTYVLPFARKSDFKTMWEIAKILRNEKYDIINTHSGIDTWCGGLGSLLSGAKFIRTRHLSTPIHPSRWNFINNLADFIMTTGESVRETMIRDNRINPAKIMSIPTGIDMGIFDKAKYNKDAMKEKYKIPKDKIIIGNLGVLRYFKRQDIFIHIAREIHKKYPNTCFVIAGDGDGKEGLKNLVVGGGEIEDASEYIKLLGHVANPAEFLSTLDVFMLTSDSHEGVPQSLMQALAMELVSIASDIGSIRDLHNGSNFVLTANPNKEEFLEALEGILRGDLKVKPSREFIIDNFSKEVMGERIAEVYWKVLER